ncbi:hypothetical protein PQE66_gp152 [Bacillus phage PBC2]|uniref:Uncharacterized protein n=1 Tax=Bacillus phage PBC2 TaxID=1675029 RepID=A0A218KC46_9CAUD|nr:hypothetical protein PQE66_gp152 [Bacillus phage PBC2]AKQ08467.1 hypothetical protein PBC2_152 [Bacillus phage PBC2]
MQQYGNPLQNIEDALDQVKEGANEVEKGLSVFQTLDWDEIFEDIDPEEKRQIMMLIDDGIDHIANGLYLIKED